MVNNHNNNDLIYINIINLKNNNQKKNNQKNNNQKNNNQKKKYFIYKSNMS